MRQQAQQQFLRQQPGMIPANIQQYNMMRANGGMQMGVNEARQRAMQGNMGNMRALYVLHKFSPLYP